MNNTVIISRDSYSIGCTECGNDPDEMDTSHPVYLFTDESRDGTVLAVCSHCRSPVAKLTYNEYEEFDVEVKSMLDG